MTLRAGFAQIDITPPLGTAKIGWLQVVIINKILDPIFARAAVIETDSQRVGFISLDTLSVRWTTAEQIRRGISEKFGFPGAHVMVAATHNHGGPAVAGAGDVKRDERYLATMVDKCIEAFGAALANRQPAQIGVGSCPEFHVAFNRRVVQRDGTAKTHGRFSDPGALFLEGPIDPEVAVIALRSRQGRPLGALVNFTCHPTHLGGEDVCTAGWPGAMSNHMKDHGWPVALFLQGAAGEIHHTNPVTGEGLSMEQAGQAVAGDALRLIASMSFRDETTALGVRSKTIDLPYRQPSPEEIAGTIRGAQRFINPAIYDRGIPAVLERIRTRRSQPAQVQVIFLDDLALASIPAEYFVRLGLEIKEKSHPRRALVVAYANGMIGYVPTAQAFERGGYETTFFTTSRMAPQTGDMLAACAIELIRQGP